MNNQKRLESIEQHMCEMKKNYPKLTKLSRNTKIIDKMKTIKMKSIKRPEIITEIREKN